MLAILIVLALVLLPGSAEVSNWQQPPSKAIAISGSSVPSPMAEKSMAWSGNYAGAMKVELFTVNRTLAKCRRLSPGSASFGVLEIGDTGRLVKRAQSRLRISSDGIFGPRTRASVVNTQRKNLLLVDGQIGRQTGCAIGLRVSFAGREPKHSAGAGISNSRTGYGDTVLAVARRFLGIPYVWGGASSRGTDCSGFTMMVYAIALHLHLPHFSGAQPRYGHRVRNPSPGDLVSWPGHVGIYYGRGMVIGARHSGTVSQIYRLYGSPSFYRMG